MCTVNENTFPFNQGQYIKILTWLQGFLVIYSIFDLDFLLLKSLLGIATQWSRENLQFVPKASESI